MTSRKLSKRQVRWSYTLSQFNFQLRFRMGKDCARPDALSQREQDMPQDSNDERLQARHMKLIKNASIEPESPKSKLVKSQISNISICQNQISSKSSSQQIPLGSDIFSNTKLQRLWDQGCTEDKDLSIMYNCVKNEERTFPIELKLKISISECDFDERGALRFRKRVWILNWEPLQTAIIQNTHDSYITGHPGHNSTYCQDCLLCIIYIWR